MNKIGIMTWYFGANYGALAQSIALHNTINSLGYESLMINYKPKHYIQTIINVNLPPLRKRLFQPAKILNGFGKCYKLSDNSKFRTSKRVNTAEDIDSLGLECVVLGSDAIFNTDHPLCSQLYYGVNIKTKKITYSPSCEYLNENTKLPRKYVDSLLEMKAISVRDINTFKLIKNNTGIVPLITLDPTFLFDFSSYCKKFIQGKYILIYSFSEWNEYKEQIIAYAKGEKLKIVSIGNTLKWADFSYPKASFEDWVSSFTNANFVMTDSYHGTIFSIKNKKQIVLCGREDKKSKILSLLVELGISIDMYKGENVGEYLKSNQIEYCRVQNNIDEEKSKSINYLIEALK
jgi:hypothetical protein